jgi:hypothetical protein
MQNNSYLSRVIPLDQKKRKNFFQVIEESVEQNVY